MVWRHAGTRVICPQNAWFWVGARDRVQYAREAYDA